MKSTLLYAVLSVFFSVSYINYKPKAPNGYSTGNDADYIINDPNKHMNYAILTYKKSIGLGPLMLLLRSFWSIDIKIPTVC